MRNKICTSIEQSKKLIELGIDIDTADMYWDTNTEPVIFFPLHDIETDWDYGQANGMVPAWTLAALLNCIKIEHNLHGFYDGMGNMVYRLETLYAGNSKTCDNPVDAVYDMLFKLKEKNLLSATHESIMALIK